MSNQAEQSKAIKLGNEYISHSDNMVLTAAKCGKALAAVKQDCETGEYTAWVKDNMPVGERQCQKFVKLYSARPEYAELNSDSLSLFDIDSEIKMVNMDNDIEKQLREENKKQKMTRKQVSERIKELKDKNDSNSTKETTSPSKALKDVCSHTIALKKEIKSAISTITNEAELKQWSKTIKDMESAIEEIKKETDKFVKAQLEIKEVAKAS